VEELKATITAQDQTISTLQAQFASLRASHEAHVASLVETHAAEVTSLKNYTRVLEDQQSQRTLHHGKPIQSRSLSSPPPSVLSPAKCVQKLILPSFE
jgi:hypothetical protein